ncbi:MAG: hypothetical protein ACLR8P_06690 [Clostridium fessum]
MTSIPEMKRSINEKKMEIRALGNVNVNAIEDYKGDIRPLRIYEKPA